MNLRYWYNRWLDLCSRVTSGRQVLQEIDGLRFVAIAAVVLFHFDLDAWKLMGDSQQAHGASNCMHDVLAQLWYGVPIFFSISAFILLVPFIKAYQAKTANRIELKSYYLRRVTRIEPPYVINLLCQYVVKSIHHSGAMAYLPHLVASLLYIHNRVYHEASTINPVAWSLEVEVQFYILAPLIAKLFLLNKAPRRLILTVAGVFLPYLAEPLGLKQSLLDNAPFFAAGILAADIYITGKSETASGMTYDLAALAALGCIIWIGHLGYVPPALGIVANLALLGGALRGHHFRRFLQMRTISVVGGMCYTIYLWHGYVVPSVWHFTKSVALGGSYWSYICVQVAILAPIAIFVCSLLFLILEKPFMHKDWPKKLARNARALFGGRSLPEAVETEPS